MNNKEIIVGGCLCGSIRYESTAKPFRSGYCHCRQCQKALGNLVGPSVMFKHQTFKFVNGDPKWWRGSLADRGFCPNCGTPIAFQYRGASHITIWVGTLDHPELFEPEAHWGVESRHVCMNMNSDLPDYTTDEYSSYAEAKARSGDS